MRLKYKLDNGKEGSIDIPLFVKDINYDQFEDFKAKERLYRDTLSKEETDENMEQTQWHMREAIGQIIDGDLSPFPHLLLEDDPKAMLHEYSYQFSPMHDELSVTRIYIHLANLMDSYRSAINPYNYQIEWYDIDAEGNRYPCTYYLNPDRGAQLLLGDTASHSNAITGKKYTSGEVLEILEFQRTFSKKIEQTGDHNGNTSFNLGLSEMAILLRKEDYKLPRTRAEFRAHVEHYKKIFAKLPLDIVFDVRFFFLAILKKYGAFLNTNYSLRAKNLLSQVRMSSKKTKENR